MYKLSNKLNAFLTDNVLPKHKGRIEKNILDSFGESDILMAKTFQVEASKTVHGVEFYVAIMRSDLEEFEPLKPNVWYPREKFDGNPNQWMLVERTIDDNGWDDFYFFEESGGDEPLHQLWDNTTHFMYIEKPNK